MVAVSETDLVLPDGEAVPSGDEGPAEGRRVVAVAVSALELLRPGSHLLEMIDGAGYVDLLLACEDEPVAAPSPVHELSAGAVDAPGSTVVDDQDGVDGEHDGDEHDGEHDDDAPDDLRTAAARLGLDELYLHRLALPAPLGATAEDDLVAALSELVGFDPGPGVCVLAPLPLPGDAGRSVIDRAVRRIAQVYELPVQRYRCMELSVVDASMA